MLFSFLLLGFELIKKFLLNFGCSVITFGKISLINDDDFLLFLQKFKLFFHIEFPLVIHHLISF